MSHQQPSQPSKEEQARIEAFMVDYQALVDKHKVDMFTFPVWVMDGEGGFKTVLQAQPIPKRDPDAPQGGTPSPEEFIPKA